VWLNLTGSEDKLQVNLSQKPCFIPSESTYEQVIYATGRFILAKVMQEAKLASQQLLQCRNYLELLFSPEASRSDE
jgi:hypothetical protein